MIEICKHCNHKNEFMHQNDLVLNNSCLKCEKPLFEYNQADRFNEGKTELSYIFDAPKACEGLANRFAIGSDKYGRNNWKSGLKWVELLDCFDRHRLAFQNGEELDEETGQPHVWAMVWNIFVLVEMYHTRPDLDDRALKQKSHNQPKPPTPPKCLKCEKPLFEYNQADRFNEGKTELSYIFDAPKACEGLANRFAIGSDKYGRNNWKSGLKWVELLDCFDRHRLAFQNGEELDEETGQPHVWAMVWNIFVLVEMYHTRPDLDDRALKQKSHNQPKPPTPPKCHNCGCVLPVGVSEYCQECKFNG